MLKKLFYLSLGLLLIIGGLKFFQSVQQIEEGEAVPTQVTVSNKVLEATPVERNDAATPSLDMSNLNMKEMEELDHEVEAIEEAWLEESKKIFTEQLHLSEEAYQEYLTMRKGYEEDRFDAYEKYHKKHLAENGSYPITNEDDSSEGVLKEYQDLFQNRFGDKVAAIYLHALDSFNSALTKDRGQDATVLKIDF